MALVSVASEVSFLEVTLVLKHAVHGTILVTKKKQPTVRSLVDMLKVQLSKCM